MPRHLPALRLPALLLPATLLLSLLAAAAPPAVPLRERTMIAEFFRAKLVYPETTQWNFTKAGPYVDGGTIYCGEANVQNSARQYIGFRRFYAVLQNGRVNEGLILGKDADDPLGTQRFKYNALCGTADTDGRRR